MVDVSKELFVKLIKAQSASEVAELLKAEGKDGTEAETLWNEIEAHRAECVLSEDELEAVSGGWSLIDPDRDWAAEGCCSTVEAGSRCRSNDMCDIWDVVYSHHPQKNIRCKNCGGYVYMLDSDNGSYTENTYKCRSCGYVFDQ